MVSVSLGFIVFVCVVLGIVAGFVLRGFTDRALADFKVGLREGAHGISPDAPAWHCPDCSAGAICVLTEDRAAGYLDCTNAHHYRLERIELQRTAGGA